MKNRSLYTIGIMMAGMLSVSAQPGDPGEDPDKVPLGGIEILLAAGGLLGAKKIMSNKIARSRKNI